MFDNQCDAYWDLSDYLPVGTVIDYWCNNNPNCKEAKRHALLSALERGDVNYQRSDGKSFQDSVYELYQRNLLLVERESFLRWADSVSAEAEKQNLNNKLPVNSRSEKTYLNIIGAMLDLMLSQSPGGQSYSILKNQSAVIDALLSHSGNKPGISERTLQEKFANAKRSLSEN